MTVNDMPLFDAAGESINSSSPPPVRVIRPREKSVPFVFSSPHSGRYYPDSLKAASQLDEHNLRASEDAWVDELFDFVAASGATQVVATHARAYLDLNRADNELDPAMFSPNLNPSLVNRSTRVKNGLGLIPKIVAQDRPIYKAPLPAREAERRIKRVYTPYHHAVQAELDRLYQKFGYAVLIDCHSMPSERAKNQTKSRSWISAKSKSAPEIVLGDRWGRACDDMLTHGCESLFLRSGFNVRRNLPYAGGYITQHYGKPDRGFHALQIEICRDLYMNEFTIEKSANFNHLKAHLQQIFSELMATHGKPLKKRTPVSNLAAE